MKPIRITTTTTTAFLLAHFAGSVQTLALDLACLNRTSALSGFVLNGIDVRDRSGHSVSSAGDVNADGVDDVIIGAYQADANGGNSGESYVVFGGAGAGSMGSIELSSLNGANGFVLNGIDAAERSGFSVSSAGDVNGDGVDDVIIGANRAAPNGFASGESYVVFGGAGVGSTGSIELSSLDGSNGFVLNGAEMYDSSGQSVSSAGDINGDGVDDVIIGAISADPNGVFSGESYVVFGGAGIGSTGVIELSSLNGINGFVLRGIGTDDFSGRSVSSAGDVNADGIDDVIIGASRGGLSVTDAGKAYIVFGSPTLGQTFPEDLNGSGCVDSDDLAILLAAWESPGADLDGDGNTDSSDLAALLAIWTP